MLLAFSLIILGTGSAEAARQPRMQRVYIFGFGASFTDSLVYQTEVQALDSAWIEPKTKFLVDRSLYSLQLQYHLESREHMSNPTCTVFFSTNPKKAQKLWNKVRRRYEKASGLKFQMLPAKRFAFKAEQWRPVETETTVIK